MDRRSNPANGVVTSVTGQECVRTLACLLLLGCLVVGGAPLWMSLMLPIVAYAGGRLAIGSGPHRVNTMRIRHIGRRSDHFGKCRRLAAELRQITETSSDRDISDRLGRMLAVIDRSLDVLAEDGRKGVAEQLYRPTQATAQLMNAYLRVERRGFDSVEERSQVLEALATIELAIDDAWFRINREAIVSLKTLSATLELTIGYEHP